MMKNNETKTENNETNIENNLNLINSNKVNISKNIKEIYNKHLLITSVDNQRYSNYKKIDLNIKQTKWHNCSQGEDSLKFAMSMPKSKTILCQYHF